MKWFKYDNQAITTNQSTKNIFLIFKPTIQLFSPPANPHISQRQQVVQHIVEKKIQSMYVSKSMVINYLINVVLSLDANNLRLKKPQLFIELLHQRSTPVYSTTVAASTTVLTRGDGPFVAASLATHSPPTADPVKVGGSINVYLLMSIYPSLESAWSRFIHLRIIRLWSGNFGKLKW